MEKHKYEEKVGIDDMVAYIPKIYLPIVDLAEARNIEYAKLNKGLGLKGMSFTDVHEDAATMAANAVRQLIEQNDLHPSSIGRIYLGTESALDGSKPTATYVLDMLTQYFEPTYGKDCFLYCDVVDLTFACIGAVDALQNTLDWVRAGKDRIGIVAGSDVAKYDLASTGEYTQGAGAVAMLVKKEPRLIAFEEEWGVSTKSVHDFFKPKRKYSKEEIIDEVLDLAGVNSVTAADLLNQLNGKLDGQGVISQSDEHIYLHKETPVFDGPYSNDCYRERIREALQHYACKMGMDKNEKVIKDWDRLIFHLPYAYQARRMFAEIFLEESRSSSHFQAGLQQAGMTEPQREHFENQEDFDKARNQFLKALTKTDLYRQFVAEKIEKGERASSWVGNWYTASIFLALMSTLEADLEENSQLEGRKLGFFAYGSGAKSKVFTGVVQSRWKEISARFRIFSRLEERQAIDYAAYEQLHRGKRKESLLPVADECYLKAVHSAKDDQEGARTYAWELKITEMA